ncbi:hypothetical protein CLV63_11297 [Murinocardiopsis flavida]|uniref:Endonuclease/exonuclease/phosphatase family metal-dependent hydrolase n=1 Tax=Murinocardiopsis flavida TaxID=645275 RepID=A0A2P8DG68_9ACTN|nr:hypothetical protein [Murinocardiopsis flavida]PSK96215.1 hypothetical protein CLV63_11297 [Murinocardiopsis flavida]
MTALPIALINLENGLHEQGFAFDDPFARIFTDVDEPPALILVNEATQWWAGGGRGGYRAASALRRRYGTPYAIEIGWCDRSDHPPALIYDPTRLEMTWWGDERSIPNLSRRNVAELRTGTGRELRVVLQHWHPKDGDTRLKEARHISWTVEGPPTLLGGDLNGTGSGPHWPEKDWPATPPHKRHHKGWQPGGPGTAWTRDTRAVDHLIGTWSPDGGRVDGCGFHALAELDWRHRGADPADQLVPTTNTRAEHGGSQAIDLLLVNDPELFVPGSYRVHIPAGLLDTDHRLVTATIGL